MESPAPRWSTRTPPTRTTRAVSLGANGQGPRPDAAMGWDYRQAEGTLWAASDLRRQMGLDEAPSRMTLWRAERRFSEEWLRELNEKVVAAFKKRLSRSPANYRSELVGAQRAPSRGVAVVPSHED